MGYNRPKVLKYITDPVTGKTLSQQRVLDSYAGFSTNPDTIPPTYDEQVIDKRFHETAQAQIDMINAAGIAKAGGLAIPKEMMYFLRKGLPEETLRSLEQTTACPNGHDVPADSAFCPRCGISMTALVPATAGEAPVDLGRLHPQTLRKMCRDKGLPDKGDKNVLIGRLKAA